MREEKNIFSCTYIPKDDGDGFLIDLFTAFKVVVVAVVVVSNIVVVAVIISFTIPWMCPVKVNLNIKILYLVMRLGWSEIRS